MMADIKSNPAETKSWLYHSEALPTGERVTLTPEQTKARKRRGQWMAIALFAFVIVVFLITMTKMGASMLVGGG
ncbi:MAG TPA: hypothetical protein VIA80_03555 [Hyphomonadaceae bacterium]|jgi:hypothetical protein